MRSSTAQQRRAQRQEQLAAFWLLNSSYHAGQIDQKALHGYAANRQHPVRLRQLASQVLTVNLGNDLAFGQSYARRRRLVRNTLGF